jgi:hypothetical protein
MSNLVFKAGIRMLKRRWRQCLMSVHKICMYVRTYVGDMQTYMNVCISIYVCISIHQWLYSPLLGSGLSFNSVIIFTQTVGLLGWVTSPSQRPYLHKGQHRHRINAYTDIHALSGIRTHDPSFRASEDILCFRSRSHRDRQMCVCTYAYMYVCYGCMDICMYKLSMNVRMYVTDVWIYVCIN